jgi:hypothetical protein
VARRIEWSYELISGRNDLWIFFINLIGKFSLSSKSSVLENYVICSKVSGSIDFLLFMGRPFILAIELNYTILAYLVERIFLFKTRLFLKRNLSKEDFMLFEKWTTQLNTC